jgi:hypothetical protein
LWDDTTEKVRKIISDIDPRYEITNIIRSHRAGKPDEKAAAVVKHRQIIVRLSDPDDFANFFGSVTFFRRFGNPGNSNKAAA